MKKWEFLAHFSSIFPLNKEEKWRKNRKSRPFREKATFKVKTNAALKNQTLKAADSKGDGAKSFYRHRKCCRNRCQFDSF